MALAKKCDRCGYYYKQESILINKLKVSGIVIIDRELDNRGYSTRDNLNLCPTCLKIAKRLAIYKK